MKVFSSLVIAAFLAVTQSVAVPNVEKPFVPAVRGPYGKDLRDCKTNWATVSQSSQRLPDCMAKLLFALTPRLKSAQGIPEINLPSWNPYVMNGYPLGSGTLTGTVAQFNIRNLTPYLNSKSAKLTYNPTIKQGTIVIRPNEIQLDGRYEITLNLGALFANGQQEAANLQKSYSEGVFSGTLKNVTFETIFSTRELKNKAGAAIGKAEVNIDFTGLEMNFKPDTPDDPVANMLNLIVNGESGFSVVQELLPPARRQMAQMMGTLFNQGWRNLDRV